MAIYNREYLIENEFILEKVTLTGKESESGCYITNKSINGIPISVNLKNINDENNTNEVLSSLDKEYSLFKNEYDKLSDDKESFKKLLKITDDEFKTLKLVEIIYDVFNNKSNKMNTFCDFVHKCTKSNGKKFTIEVSFSNTDGKIEPTIGKGSAE